jgi:uncharacterized protein (TIGR02265 family)
MSSPQQTPPGGVEKADEAPVVFRHTVQSLRRVLEPVFDVEVARRLTKIGIDLSDLSPSYPLATWVSALQLAMDALYPDLPVEAASFRLGNAFIHSYAETLVGKVLAASSRLIGPARALAATARNLRTGNNYSRVSVKTPSPNTLEVTLNIAPFPHYFAGMFQGGLLLSGGVNPQVEFAGQMPEGFLYRARWK